MNKTYVETWFLTFWWLQSRERQGFSDVALIRVNSLYLNFSYLLNLNVLYLNFLDILTFLHIIFLYFNFSISWLFMSSSLIFNISHYIFYTLIFVLPTQPFHHCFSVLFLNNMPLKCQLVLLNLHFHTTTYTHEISRCLIQVSRQYFKMLISRDCHEKNDTTQKIFK